MGGIADLLANAKTFGPGDPLYRELERLAATGDVPTGSTHTAKNAVQTVLQYTSDPSGGTFTLTLNIRYLAPITTAGIAYNAAAATIETAIDTAVTSAGTVAGWTNGDITVSGGTLLAAGADVVLTYDGTSVAGINQGLVTIDGASLTGGSLASPATVVTTPGQTIRRAVCVLHKQGITAIPYPAQTDDPSVWTVGDNLRPMKPRFLREMAQEIAAEDGNRASYDGIQLAFGQDDKAPLVYD